MSLAAAACCHGNVLLRACFIKSVQIMWGNSSNTKAESTIQTLLLELPGLVVGGRTSTRGNLQRIFCQLPALMAWALSGDIPSSLLWDGVWPPEKFSPAAGASSAHGMGQWFWKAEWWSDLCSFLHGLIFIPTAPARYPNVSVDLWLYNAEELFVLQINKFGL